MTSIRVRYIVNDVDSALAFYTEHLGFEVEMHPAPGFAALRRESLQLLLNAPGTGGAGASMPVRVAGALFHPQNRARIRAGRSRRRDRSRKEGDRKQDRTHEAEYQGVPR